MSAAGAPERRREERRAEPRLAELTLPEVRRIVLTTAVFVGVVGLFVWMVRDVLVAGMLGVVAAVYLRPLYLALRARVRHPAAAAIATLVIVVTPLVAALAYSYVEVGRVTAYVAAHEGEVSARIADALRRLGIAGATGPDDLTASARRWVVAMAGYAAAVPGAVRGALARGAVAASVFAFTVVYILTQSATVAAYLRGMVSPRYAGLAGALERNVRAVLAGTIYGTLLTQLVKSAVILALALAFDVPLAALLTLLSFVLGLLPILGSWSVYVPMAGWLFAFRDALGAALVVLAAGFLVNTLFVSMYLRPRIAARRSRVLNFYWMFLGLVTGVYALGLPGLVLGPALIAMLKAVVDTVVEPSVWPADEDTDGAGRATDAVAEARA